MALLGCSRNTLTELLKRGEQLGWLESNEIIAEFIISAVGFYYFFAHSLTTQNPFIQFALFKDRNFITGCIFMAVIGLVLYSTIALSSPYLQNVIGYPIITAGALLASRGCGTFVAMMLVGRLMRYIEARTLIISGLSLTAGNVIVGTSVSGGSVGRSRLRSGGSGFGPVLGGSPGRPQRVPLPLTTRDFTPLRLSCSSNGRTSRKPTKVASVCHQMLWGRWGSWTLHSGFDPSRAALRSLSGSESQLPPRAT